MAGKKLWGGRFTGSTSELTERFTVSVDFDKRLYAEDIRGSLAHARMLARQGVIEEQDAVSIENGLAGIKREIENGAFKWNESMEDVHMNVEARLTELIGEAGKRLHTGRSRNDQVATDFRLHVAVRLADWMGRARELAAVLAERAGEHLDTLLPGYTHLQPAQPVRLSHHLLAYAQMFKRDCERIGDCLKRVKVSPLGAAALAGTTYPLDPDATARDMGFGARFANSMDAVSDRDFAAEAVFCASLVMVHLSRLSEELIIWANPGFGFVRLPDAFATGSSIMPQKKNPDVSELTRGKTARVFGDLTALLTLMKGLPLAYNRDMQEDKEPFFDADETVTLALTVNAAMMREMVFDAEAMRKAMAKGFINATELADYLVGKGAAFRAAHEVSGRAVALAQDRGVGLEDLSLDDLQGLSELIEQDVFEALDYQNAADRRETPGGTGKNAVRAQLADFKAWLEQAG
jgi:argininosuccinate lyase